MTKTMHQIIGIFLFILIPIAITHAQSYNTQWGESFKESAKISVSEIIGLDNNKTVVFRQNKKKVIIDLLDENNTREDLLEIELKTEKKTRHFVSALYLDSELYIFSTFINKKHKKTYLFVEKFNTETMSFSGDIKKIAETDNILKGLRYSRYSSPFNILISSDESKVLVYHNKKYQRSKDEALGVNVFDDKMNEIWNSDITIPYPDKLYQIEDYIIDNSGKFHLLSSVYNEKRVEKRKGKPNYIYELLTFSSNSSEPISNKLVSDKMFITEMKVRVTDEDEIICAGFYSNKGTFQIRGSYYMKVDANSGSVLVENIKPFSVNFITQNMKKGKAKRIKKKAKKGKKPELYKYDLDDLIVREDGSSVLIGEQFYIIISTHTTVDANGGTSTTTTTTYYYNDIIVINFSPDGKITWAKKIPKHQVSSLSNYSSYALHTKGNDLFFIFNDNKKNLEPGFDGKVRNFTGGKNGIVAVVKMDKSGNQTKQALFGIKDIEALLNPNLCRQINDNTTILYAKKRKKQQIGKLRL